MKLNIATIVFIQALLAGGVSARITRMNRIEEALRSHQSQRQHVPASKAQRKQNLASRSKTANDKEFRSKPKDDAIGRRETSLVHDHGASMGVLQKFTMEDNDMCAYENENVYFSPSYLNPFWFYSINDQQNFMRKDFSPYFECTDSYPDYFNCDFTNMLEHVVGPCQLFGGTMYSVSLNQTCSDEEGGTMYNDTNLPMCLGSSCVFNESSVENDVNFDFCAGSEASFEAEVVKMESLASDECLSEVQNIRETSGLQDPDFIFNIEDIDVFGLYCSSETTSDETIIDVCDFTPLLEDYREPCENEGGILYRFSDKTSFTEGYYDGIPLEATFKNIPVCIGTSCHAKNYFEKYIFPYYSFLFEGDFYQEDGYYPNDDLYYRPTVTYQYSATYQPLEYAPVLETENPYSKFLLSFQVEDGEQVDNIKRCKWLTKKTDEMKKKICSSKKYQVYSEQSGVGPASLACPDTCAPYCHTEKGNAKFVYEMDDTEGLITKQCKWLESQDQEVVASVCATEVDVGGGTIYGQAAETCRQTCESC